MVRKKLSRKEHLKKQSMLIFMALPAVILLFCFTYMPKFGIILAFQDYNYQDGFASPFVGLDNFKYIFSSGEVWRAARNTVLYNLANIIIIHTLAIVAAIMLYMVNKKASKRYQFIITIPYLASMAVIVAIVYLFLRYDGGLVNNLLEMAGKKPVAWYLEPKIWPFVLVFVNAWFGAGIKSIYFYSIFMGVDSGLFEAIDIDGGKWRHKIRYIMLPEIVPILCLFLIQSLGTLLHGGFELYYAVPMDSSALYSVTETLGTYEYHGLTMGNIGTTTAVGVVVGVLNMIGLHTVNSIVKKVSPDNSMY